MGSWHSREYFWCISFEASVPFRKMLPKFTVLFLVSKGKHLHFLNKLEGEATPDFNTVTERSWLTYFKIKKTMIWTVSRKKLNIKDTSASLEGMQQCCIYTTGRLINVKKVDSCDKNENSFHQLWTHNVSSANWTPFAKVSQVALQL